MILRIPSLWTIALISCWIPFIWLFADSLLDHLGSNPIQAVHIRLGDWSLRFLWLTLAITPLQTMTQWRGMTPYRQLFGLTSFFYASLHVFGYVFLDHYGQWHTIGTDIIESTYLWFGVFTYCIIFLLAITTPKYAKKRLGKNWKKLHRYIYLASIAAIIHYFWQLKGNLANPLLYLIILFVLLGFRLLVWLKNRQLAKMMIPKGRTRE